MPISVENLWQYWSKCDIGSIVELAAGCLWDWSRHFVPLVLSSAFSLILVLTTLLGTLVVDVISRLLVAGVIRLLQFEIRIVESFLVSRLICLILVLHCIVSWIVGAWQSLDMRRECSIMCYSLLSLNMVSFAMVSSNIIPLLHDIHAGGRAW